MEETSTRPQEAAVPEDESSTQSLSEEETSGSEQAADQLPPPSAGPEPEKTQQTHPLPNMVEPLSDHRGNRECLCVDYSYTQSPRWGFFKLSCFT